MPDLYAINLHLQERLERGWLEEVRAVEAARWLDEAGLLSDQKRGFPLRKLLRAGRIAGQEQRPNEKNGSWFVRRLAESRDPHAIRRARGQLRSYLPIERANFPADWPVNQGPPVFWQELGKAVAAFGYLEHILANICYELLTTSEKTAAVSSAGDDVISRWYKRILSSQVDSLHSLTRELDRLLAEDSRIPHTVRKDLVERLDDLRRSRNALSHGAWLGVDKDGSASLHHLYRHQGTPVAFPPVLALTDLSDIRGRTVDATFRVAEAASIVSARSPLASAMPREYEPRNAPPERE